MALCQWQLRDRAKLQNGNSTKTGAFAILDIFTGVRSANILTNVLWNKTSNDSSDIAQATIYFIFLLTWFGKCSRHINPLWSPTWPRVFRRLLLRSVRVCVRVLQEKLPQVEDAPPPIGLKQAFASSRQGHAHSSCYNWLKVDLRVKCDHRKWSVAEVLVPDVWYH